MSCCDNRYAPLKASGELTEEHLGALRDYSKTVKPVYRASCPPGYTHCTRAFPKDNPASVANNKLWFIDGHGHLCMPKCGWGSQPELRMKDKAAQMVRSGEIDTAKVTPEKLQAAAARMQCDPCGKGTKNVSRVANMLSCTLRDLQRVDAEVEAKAATNPLAGGMHHRSGMGGCWSRSMSGGGGGPMVAAGETASLAGGSKTSATKCELQRMVTGVDETRLEEAATAAMKPVVDKKETYHTEKLLCKLLALHEHSPLTTGPDDPRLLSEEDISELAQEAVKNAIYCVTVAPLVSQAEAKRNGCVPSSCYSKTFKIDNTELKQWTKVFKTGKHAFDSLLRLFVEYKKAAKMCEPEKAEAERIITFKIEQVIQNSIIDVTKCGAGTDVTFIRDINTNIPAFKQQMKAVAALKCDEPNIDTTCTRAGGARVCSGTSMVCMPKMLADAKVVLKALKKQVQVNSLIYEYQKVIITDLRRTLNA